jgi:hypothetical protein
MCIEFVYISIGYLGCKVLLEHVWMYLDIRCTELMVIEILDVDNTPEESYV